ncbi:hypothetical protein G3N59_01055 [Paraburkholderia sp. Ac-20340]|nr:hypothetical protein [Paraburkholderia sp. Ac-20340]
MATRAKTTRQRDVACIRIGFNSYLLDADKAMQVLKLMRESVECERDYANRKVRYVAGQSPDLELSMIQPSEVAMPQNSLALEDQRW